jgi:hypothetical protein
MLNLTNILWVKVPQGLASVSKTGTQVTSVTDLFAGIVYSAKVFIDASYEGDLLALANATTVYGREPNTTYMEPFGGRRQPYSTMDWAPVSPFDAATGALMPLATDAYAAPLGSGDDKVQAYNFRLCVSKDPSNRIPFTQPPGYNSSLYALLRKYAAVAPPVLSSYLNNIQELPNGKYDMNNGGIISTDCPGCGWTWPTFTNPMDRQALWQAHYDYQAGFLWTLANDTAIPAAVRDAINEFGLCADEFGSSPIPGWPEQLYVREARRLVGDVVFTQNDVEAHTDYNHSSIGLGFITNNSQLIKDSQVQQNLLKNHLVHVKDQLDFLLDQKLSAQLKNPSQTHRGWLNQ